MNIETLGTGLADLQVAASQRLESLKHHRDRTTETFRAFIADLDTLRARLIESSDMIDADMAKQIFEEELLIGESSIEGSVGPETGKPHQRGG